MKNRSIRLQAAAAATLLTAVCFTASCTDSGSDGGGQNRGGTRDKVKITVHMIGGKPLPDPKGDPIKAKLDERLGIDLTVRMFLPEEYANQMKMGLATGASADLFGIGNRQDFVQYAKQGALLDLSPYLDLLAPALGFVGKDRLRLTEVNGGIYGIPRSETAYQYTYWIRRDWLEKLKLPVPRTVEEFRSVVQAMADGDPDGNGRKDTFGLSGRPHQALGPLFGAYGTTYPGSFYIKDGALVNSLYDPAMKEALRYIKTVFETGGVDPGFVSNTSLQHKEKALQGQVGLFYFNWPNWQRDEYLKADPQADWMPIDVPAGPGGRHAYAKDVSESIVVISKTAGGDKVKLNKIIQLLNYVSSPEGNKLAMYGIEGKHYTESGGKVTVREVLKETLGYAYQLTGRDEMAYLAAKFPDRVADFTFAAQQPRISIYDGLVAPPEGFRLEEAKRYIEEELWKFLYGNRPLESYDAFLAELDGKYGYLGYVEAAKRQFESWGVRAD